jgi:hypothetical protein
MLSFHIIYHDTYEHFYQKVFLLINLTLHSIMYHMDCHPIKYEYYSLLSYFILIHTTNLIIVQVAVNSLNIHIDILYYLFRIFFLFLFILVKYHYNISIYPKMFLFLIILMIPFIYFLLYNIIYIDYILFNFLIFSFYCISLIVSQILFFITVNFSMYILIYNFLFSIIYLIIDSHKSTKSSSNFFVSSSNIFFFCSKSSFFLFKILFFFTLQKKITI